MECMDSSFNIVALIEHNPVTQLSDTYNNILLGKIKERFSESEQQLYVSSFYCFLNYHPTHDFVVDFDDVWPWLGYSTKQKARIMLEKHFVANDDYRQVFNQLVKQEASTNGGRPRETIMLNVNTFKLFCMKAGTKKADDIHAYFVKLETLLHETIQEECAEFKRLLEVQKQVMEARVTWEYNQSRENTLVEQFPANVQCVYYGRIDDLSADGETLVKFGNSNFLGDRIKRHKNTYTNFQLINAFRVDNCQQVENAIKYDVAITDMRRRIQLRGKVHTELLAWNDASYRALDALIVGVIRRIECNPQNYSTLLIENDRLKKRLHVLSKKMDDRERKEAHRGETPEFSSHLPPAQLTSGTPASLEGESGLHGAPDTPELCPDAAIPATFVQVREHNKSRGKYYINDMVYDKCIGSREEVWATTAYKTSGGLLRTDLMKSTSVHNAGKLVSRTKHIQGKRKSYNPFHGETRDD